MRNAPGTYTLGPDNGELLVHTRRSGAAAKAGHDLVIEVTSWSGVLDLSDGGSATLRADSTSFRVRDGHGGVQALDDDDKDNIRQTIDDEVLEGSAIEFHSTGVVVAEDGERVRVDGELELAGSTAPISFDLSVAADGHLTGTATVTQSEWGMKPYSALFGALKVADEVEVTIDARLER
jgi:polyisoprenoid-binding protein YceI